MLFSDYKPRSWEREISVLELTSEDQRIIEELKDIGVLTHLDPSKLPIKMVDGIDMCFAVMCSDGHRFSNTYGHFERLLNTQTQAQAMVHPFTDHGAPLFLALDSPLNRRERGNNLLESIGDVPRIKGTTSGLICPHAPCSAAASFGLNVAQQIAFAKAGKARILAELPLYKEQDIACLLHITSEAGKELTYKVSATPWKQWASENMPSILQVA